MGKVLGFYENMYNENHAALQKWFSTIQSVVDHFHSLEGVSPMKNGELSKLFTNPKGLVVDKLLTGQQQLLNNAILDKEKLGDLVKMPTGFNELLDMVDDVVKKTNQGSMFITPKSIEDITIFFKLFDGKIAITETVLNEVRKKYTIELETSEANLVYEKAETILGIINDKDFQSIIATRYREPQGLKRFLSELFMIAPGYPITIDKDVVKGFDVAFK
jgi:hypothetical protein